MAGCTNLIYLRKNCIIITVQMQGFHILKMSGSQSFDPEFLAAAAPVSHFAGSDRHIKGFFVHIGQHQHLIGFIILYNDRNHSVTV